MTVMAAEPQSKSDAVSGPNWSPGRRGLWLLLACASTAIMAPAVMSWLKPPPRTVYDFYQEWSSARNWRIGQPVYRPIAETFAPYVGLRLKSGSPLIWTVNVHPPPAVLLAIPFEPLDYRDATLAWNLASLGCLVAAAGIVISTLTVRPSVWSLLPWVALLPWFDPFRQQFVQGQLNLILLLLVVGAWAADRRGRSLLAGGLVGLAAAIKLFPGFLLLYFAGRRNWRAVAGGGLSLVLTTLVTLAVLGPVAYRDYGTQVLPDAGKWVGTNANASLTSFWRKLFDPTGHFGPSVALVNSPWLARGLMLLSVAVIAGVVIHAARHAKSARESDRAYALAIIGMLLLSPVTWNHYFLLLLIPVVICWRSTKDHRLMRWLLILALVCLGIPINPFIEGLVPYEQLSMPSAGWYSLTLLSIQCYALLALFGLQVLATRSRSPSSSGTTSLDSGSSAE